MSSYSYVMVTDFKGHWDRCPDNRSRYPKRMMKNGLRVASLAESAPTLFIKRETRDGTVSGCWEGVVHTFIESDDLVWFTVKIDKQVECPPEYREYHNGWYLIDDAYESKMQHGTDIINNNLPDAIFTPQLVRAIEVETDYKKFENYVYYLLKAIGINDIIRFQQEHQAGKADGLFEFGSLAVLYDATLSRNFVDNKEVQIDNYCAQLEGPITYENITFNVHRKPHKMVWIVTRNRGELFVEERGSISVREIPVSRLVDIFYKRYRREIYREQDLELDLLSFLRPLRGSL